MSLSFDELRQASLNRLPYFHESIDDWNIAEWMNAVAGETGEACNLAKKHLRQSPFDPPRAELEREIAHELADIVAYVDLAAARLGIDLGEAVRAKFNLVSKRVGYTKEL